MRRKLAQRVRQEFGDRLAAAAPEFRPVAVSAMVPGYRVYYLDRMTRLKWFLVLELPSRTYWDEFAVSLYGTEQSEFPSYHVALQDPAGNLEKGTIAFKIGQLFVGRTDYWWEVAREPSMAELLEGLGKNLSEPLDACLARVPGCVADCVSKVREYVLPYIEARESGNWRASRTAPADCECAAAEPGACRTGSC